MKTLWPHARTLAGIFLVASLALTVTAAAPRHPTRKDASGCSLITSTNGTSSHPAANGCLGGGGGCYDCLYSGAGGYTQCYENLEGIITFCYDFQNV